MYDVAYHLNADPFRLSPDHFYCFQHESYAKSKAYLDYALTRGEGFVMITGAPGSGKTTLLNDVLTNADNSNRAMARIVTTQLDANDLLRMVAYSFRLNTQRVDKASILYQLEAFLIRQHQQHRHSLLVIDEAQDLDKTALEEIRLLTNLQIDGNSLLQVFLVGQNNLQEIIQDPSMEQLHQRLIASSHLEPMKAEETEIYVTHRLRLAGWKNDPLISRGALRRIHFFSRGVPRIVNQVCSRFLLYGSVENKHKLDSHDVQEVIKELCHEHLAPITHDKFPGILSSTNDPAKEKDSIEQFDKEFLDSTAFSESPRQNEPAIPEVNPAKPQQPSHLKPVTEKKSVAASHNYKKKQEILPESNANHNNTSVKTTAKLKTVTSNNLSKTPPIQRTASSRKISDNLENNGAARHLKEHPPYALVGILILLLTVTLFLIYPEPADYPAISPDHTITRKNSDNPKVDQAVNLHNIGDSLTRHAIQFNQSTQGMFELKLNIQDQFAWGSAIMSHALQTKLNSLAKVMQNYPQTVLHITGHSDPTGSEARNKILSDNRAKVVANFFVLQNIPQHRLTIDGMGSRKIINRNNPKVNRRVELLIEILRPGSDA